MFSGIQGVKILRSSVVCAEFLQKTVLHLLIISLIQIQTKCSEVSIGFAFRRARLQYVYSILRGKDLDTGQYSTTRRDQQFERLKEAQSKALDIQNWHEFIKAAKQAGFARKDYISSDVNLLYSYVFFLIGREDFNMNLYDLKKLISRYLYMSSITRRYTGSAETAMEMDLAKLRNIETSEQFAGDLE